MYQHFKNLVFVFLLAFSLAAYAGYVEKFPITVTQPDGEIVHCFTSGDEFFNWVHDSNGYTLVRDPQTGVVVYAQLQNDELVSTGYRVGSVAPASIGLQPWTIISAEKREQLRRDFINTAPLKKTRKDNGISNAGQNDGVINNIVIYIRFADETEFATKANIYEDMFNKDSANFPSMYRYFKETSYGKTLISSTFYPTSNGNTIISYQDSFPRSCYQSYCGDTNATKEKLLRRAIEDVSSQISPTLDLDFNNDGEVDNICFIIRGAPGAWGSTLWPHKSYYPTYLESIFINGKRVGNYNVQIENLLDSRGVGILAHEMFHTFGAPDLYTVTSFIPVGTWDLMAFDTYIPQSSLAYMKYKYGGWIDSIPEITQSGTYTLNNVWHPTNNAYKIASPNSATEFFVVEYRNKSIYWDSLIPGSGLIIYRINTMAWNGSTQEPDEIYIFRPRGNNTSTNGIIDSAHFSSQEGRTVFHNFTDPPCFLSNNQHGGIYIRNIGVSGGLTMNFDVFFENFTITTFAGNNGIITPASNIVNGGENETFTFEAKLGAAVDSLLIDGVNVPDSIAGGSYTFYNVTKNHTIAIRCKPAFCNGDGTAGNPYQICTAEELAALAGYVNDGYGNNTTGKHYMLMNNIDLSKYAIGAGWKPIGNNSAYNSSTYFRGNFNGNGKVVKNLTINRPTENYIGLFGYIDSATIQKLGMENSDIKGNSDVGGLAGYSNNSSIINSYTIGRVYGNSNYVGGLVGYSGRSSIFSITNCYVACSVYGNSDNTGGIGGLVGYNWNTSIQNCVAANDSVISIQNITRVNRIIGNTGDNNVRNNYAFSGMVVQVNGIDIDITDGTVSAGMGKNMDTLQSLSFYNTASNWHIPVWDMTNIWDICDGESLPFFRSQKVIPVTDIIGIPDTATKGKPLILTGTIIPNDATNQNIIWSVKDAGTTGATIVETPLMAFLHTTDSGTVIITATIAKGTTMCVNYTQDFNMTVTIKDSVVGIVGAYGIRPIQVYPNPTNDKLFIECEEIMPITIKLYDVSGKEVLTQTTNSKTEINIDHLSNGVYNVSVFSEGKVIGNSKIAKQ